MYKTILLHVDRDDALPARLDIGTALAQRHDAHLVGCVATGLTAAEHAALLAGSFGPLVPRGAPGLGESAAITLEPFLTAARHCGVVSSARVVPDHAGPALVALSPYADLVVTGQDCGAAVAAGVAVGIPDHVALHAACPVLMVPAACHAGQVGRTILVAWNGTIEAAHAVHAALPLLRDAKLVLVAVVGAETLALPHIAQPGAELAAWLCRHGVRLEVTLAHATGNPGTVLLHLARQAGADLVVAGAYGHNRFRELVAGGTTRVLLDNQDCCVLLAH